MTYLSKQQTRVRQSSRFNIISDAQDLDKSNWWSLTLPDHRDFADLEFYLVGANRQPGTNQWSFAVFWLLNPLTDRLPGRQLYSSVSYHIPDCIRPWLFPNDHASPCCIFLGQMTAIFYAVMDGLDISIFKRTSIEEDPQEQNLPMIARYRLNYWGEVTSFPGPKSSRNDRLRDMKMWGG